MQNKCTHDWALHSLKADVFSALQEQQELLKKNIADLFDAHAKRTEQLESARVDQLSPSSPPPESIHGETAGSRSSSLRSIKPTQEEDQYEGVPMLAQTVQVQESELEMPHQVMEFQPRAQTSVFTEARMSTSTQESLAWGLEPTTYEAPEPARGASMYARESEKATREGSTRTPQLQKKRTGVSLTDVEHPVEVPVPRPIHPIFPRIAKMNAFETFSVLAVISNALTIALQADWAVNHIGEDLPIIFDVLEIMFTFIFLIELFIRILASGRFFFSWHNRELNWNIFDSVLVSSSILELPLLFLLGSAVNFTSARLLRLMRLVRLVRIVRLLRVFRQLRVVVQTVAASLKPLLWAMILLFVVIFLSSVVILQLLETELVVGDELEPDLKELYGSLMRAQYTLFLCITNGVSWQAVAEPLIKISASFGFFFILFISFSFFCMVNIVTGIFVENTASQSQQDDEMIVFEEAAQREAWLKQVKELFDRCDFSGDGLITADEFEASVEDIKLQVMLKNIGIDIFQINPRGLFRCLDFDNNGSITINEFAEGLMRLHGQARSLDLADVRHFVMLCLSNAERIRELVEDLAIDTKGDKKKKKKTALAPLPPRSSFFLEPTAPDMPLEQIPLRVSARP